ncbi:MAG: NAD(P)-dependent oxidoreductase [Rubrivivax sp.]|nr:NAD(P)-dependent oxidoreductase [Rubrivivax sp.]
MTTAFETLLLTGAAGTLGRALTPPLQALAQRLRVSDLAEPLLRVTLPAGVEAVPCDLADAAAVHRLLRGVQAIVHLGGISVEGPFEPILQANIRGLHNLYEAARRQGVRRVVFASSNHVTGCYRQAQTLTPQDRPRPDGNYGLSKLFGEGIASLYWDRFGIETVCLRIGTATPAPPDKRGLSTWISLPDLARLVTCALTAPGVGFLVAYGISGNTRAFWDTAQAWQQLGFVPEHDAETFAPQVQHLLQPEGPQRLLQGGSFLGLGPYGDEDRCNERNDDNTAA